MSTSGQIYTIRFPYKAPDKRVRGTGRWIAFEDVADGQLFAYAGGLHEKLGAGQCACLAPIWDYEVFDLPPGAMCEVVEEVG